MAATTSTRTEDIRALIRAHKRWDALFAVCGILALMVATLTLVALFVDMAVTGIPRLTGDFFVSFPSRRWLDLRHSPWNGKPTAA